jgi:IclR family transcriptional regulator, pca regulon regulatory protein
MANSPQSRPLRPVPRARIARAGKNPPRREFVQSVERGFAVIKAFSSQTESLTIAGVSRRTALSRAVSRRFLMTLGELGYVASDGGMFRLTPRVLDLGFTFLSTMRLPDVAQPVMEELVSTLHESCSVSVLDGQEIVYVVRVPAKRIMSIALAVGTRLPAYPTSMGRVLLAALEPVALDEYLAAATLRPLTPRTITDKAQLRRVIGQVRERGWASVDQEVEVGVRSVAAPIRDRTGRTVAAINISSHVSRVNLKELRGRHLPIVIEAAGRISAMLGAPARS